MMVRMFSMLMSLSLLSACGTSSEISPASKSSSSASQATPTDNEMNQLTFRQAEDAVRLLGYEVSSSSTGPGEAFSLEFSNEDGTQLQINKYILENPRHAEFYRNQVPDGAARLESGRNLLSVHAQKDETPTPDTAARILAVLLDRAQNPVELISLMTLPEGHWLTPRTATVDGFLVIAPELIDLTIQALTANGVSVDAPGYGQKVDLSNPKDAGYPGYVLLGQHNDTYIELRLRCLRKETDRQFWPTPESAKLGEAIIIKDQCNLTSSVKLKLGQLSDKDQSKSLLDKLLSWSPPQ